MSALTGSERRTVRLRQLRRVAALELARAFRGRSALPLWLLALAPLAIFGAWALAGLLPGRTAPVELRETGEHAVVFAALFHTFLLRVIIFFGCVVIFSNLFRRDIGEQTLHYLLLTPIRREIVVAGKYAAGVAAAWLVFLPLVGVCFALFYLPMRVSGAGLLADGLTYVFLTALACVGYGAVFLAFGLFFRNPIVPALVVGAWEGINVVLPGVLQRLSVVHYLTQMSPVPVPESPFAIPVTPTPAVIAVPGLILVSALALAISAARVRRLEASYGVD